MLTCTFPRYYECFAAGVYCVEPCTCQECFNKPEYKDMVLGTRQQIESRNPLAFAPKIVRGVDFPPTNGVRKWLEILCFHVCSL